MPPNAGQNEQSLPNKTSQNIGEAELESLLHKLFYYSTQLQPEKNPANSHKEKNISTFLSSLLI